MHFSLAYLAKVLHSHDIAECLLNVCASGLQKQMKPRCCLVMDQRVGRRDCSRTSYWLPQADVKLYKTCLKDFIQSSRKGE